MQAMKFVLLSLCAAVMWTSCAESQENRVIPIETQRNNTSITVKIGETSIDNIILDTGFDYDGLIIYNPVYRDSISTAGAAEVRIGGAGSGEGTPALLLDSAEFRIGDLTLKRQRIIILQSDIYKGFPSNGIIGYSIFGHYTVELNHDDNTMTLHEPGSAKIGGDWTMLPIYFKENDVPWVDISVATVGERAWPLSAYIDLADGAAAVLLEKAGMKFILPEDTTSVLLGRGLSGDVYGKKGVVSRIIIGPHELKRVPAFFAAAGIRSKQRNADAVIGNGALRRFNVIFDYANRKLYLKPNRHFADRW